MASGAPTAATLRVGVISDTHGLLREHALDFLRGSDLIIHAGDVCDSDVTDALKDLAPLTVVRGNNDKGAWADGLAENELIGVGEIFVYIIHDLARIDLDPVAAGVRVVVSGHSHKPSINHRDGILFLNPGSAGPRRFKLPISVAELLIQGRSVSARLIDLAGDKDS